MKSCIFTALVAISIFVTNKEKRKHNMTLQKILGPETPYPGNLSDRSESTIGSEIDFDELFEHSDGGLNSPSPLTFENARSI